MANQIKNEMVRPVTSNLAPTLGLENKAEQSTVLMDGG